MSMWLCEDCAAYTQYTTDPIDRRCPLCGGVLVRQHKCKRCGKWNPDSVTCWELCPKCREETDNEFKTLLGLFTREQIEYLDNRYDGESLEAIL